MRLAGSLGVMALLAAAGCASGAAKQAPTAPSTRESIVLTRWTPPSGQVCTIAASPAVLPSAGELVDTAALVSQTVARAAGPDRHALFSLRFDEAGYATRVRLIEPQVGDSARGDLEAAVKAALRERPAGEPFGVRLRLDFDPAGTTRFRVGRSEHCAPARMKNRRSGSTNARRPGGDPSVQITRGSVPVTWDVFVSETGQVIDVAPVGTTQLSSEAVGLLIDAMRKSSWYPGRDDGVPVAMRTTFKENIRMTTITSTR